MLKRIGSVVIWVIVVFFMYRSFVSKDVATNVPGANSSNGNFSGGDLEFYQDKNYNKLTKNNFFPNLGAKGGGGAF